MAPRPAQAAVWHDVSRRLAQHQVASATHALSDVYAEKRRALDELTHGIEPAEGQVGVIAEISGRPAALDLVSRPEVFADLLPRLLSGYALQSLRAPISPASKSLAEEFLAMVRNSSRRWRPTPGMGDAFALDASGARGCGLTVADESIALSAFPVSGQAT